MHIATPHWNFRRKVLVPILLIMAALVAVTTLALFTFRRLFCSPR